MILIKFAPETHVKPHIVMKSLRNVVVADIGGRFAMTNPVASEETCASYRFDPGGIFWPGVPEYKFRFRDGFSVLVNVQYFDLFCMAIEKAQTRVERGKAYYKIHGWTFCLCLTPERMDKLREWATDIEEEADAVFDAFMAKKNAKCTITK